MPPTTPPTEVRSEGEFADWLAAFDESLASARDTDLDAGPPTPPTERARRASACLERLESVWPRAAGLPAAPDAPPPTLEELARLREEELRGRRFGRFVIERELGRGGHGVVFLAADPRLRRKVALKVPRPDVLVTADLRRRFLREAQAAAVLDHPNVVPIYETGETGPACYLAAAYCDGPTLGDWVQQRPAPVPPRQAALIALRMAEALQHAHDRRIFHRDVKPSNILLEPRPLNPARPGDEALPFTPKLTDFGLAKVVEESCGNDTRTGAILGTPRYMAPEQAEGRLKDVGPGTDVHGVGVTLYELLAGQPPYVGIGDGETLHLVRTAEPTPPSKHRDGVPQDLEAICLKCLEKEVGQRYPTAQALAEDLRRFLADQPTLARPIRWPDRVLRWARREPMGAAFAVGCVLAALSITSTWVWYTLKVQAAAEMAASFGREIGERDRALRGQLAAAELQVAAKAWEAGDRGSGARRLAKLAADRTAPPTLGSVLKLAQRVMRHPAVLETPTTLPELTRRWASATVSPEGTCLLGVTKEGTLQRLDLANGRLSWSVPLRGSLAGPVVWRWAPDGCRVAGTAADGRLFIADRQGELLFEGSWQGVPVLPCGRRSRFLFLGLAKGHGLVGVFADGARQPLPSGLDDFADAALLGDESAVLLLRRRGGVKVVDLRAEEVTLALPTPAPGEWRRVAVDPAGRFAAAFSAAGAAAFWDLQTGKRWVGESTAAAPPAAFGFLPDAKTLVYAAADGRCSAWHVPTGRLILNTPATTGAVLGAAFDDAGLHLLTRPAGPVPTPLALRRAFE